MFISRGILRFLHKTAFLSPARFALAHTKKTKNRADICPPRAAARSYFLLAIFGRRGIFNDFIQKIFSISLFYLVCAICEYFLNFLMKNA